MQLGKVLAQDVRTIFQAKQSKAAEEEIAKQTASNFNPATNYLLSAYLKHM